MGTAPPCPLAVTLEEAEGFLRVLSYLSYTTHVTQGKKGTVGNVCVYPPRKTSLTPCHHRRRSQGKQEVRRDCQALVALVCLQRGKWAGVQRGSLDSGEAGYTEHRSSRIKQISMYVEDNRSHNRSQALAL